MPKKHLRRVVVIFFLLTGFLLACNLSSEASQKVNLETQPNEKLPKLTGKSASSNLLLKDVVEKISSELNYNETEIKLNPEDFQYLENPIGEGIFIYEPETKFFGVERYFIWVYLNNNIYVVNGATRGVTPNILVARDVPAEVWDPTNLSSYSATKLIEYIFEGKELIP